MRTPAGKECRHYYEDYYRGRETQECRLIQANPASLRWKPSDCVKCPVPDILNANSSSDMQLQLTVKPRLLGLGRQLRRLPQMQCRTPRARRVLAGFTAKR